MQTKMNGSPHHGPAGANASVQVLKRWAAQEDSRQHLLIEAPSADSIACGPEDELVELFGSVTRWMSVEEVDG